MQEQGIPAPPDLVSTIDPSVVLIAFGGLVGIAAAIAIVLSLRWKDAMPIVACIGSLICALNEPIYDILGKIVYAQNNVMAYHAFGRNVPWFLVIGYLPFVGLLPCVIARMMAAGVARNRFHWIAFLSFIGVVIIETLGNRFEFWTYYGEAPLKYLVVAPQMAPVPIVGGFLLYALADSLRGWQRLLAGLSISTLTLPAVFASASWPLYVGLYTDLPVAADWGLGALMLAFCAATVGAATALAHRMRAGTVASAEVSTRVR